MTQSHNIEGALLSWSCHSC